jgi:hypothetical protein
MVQLNNAFQHHYGFLKVLVARSLQHTWPTVHPRAQRNVFRRRDVRPQLTQFTIKTNVK